MIVNSDGQVKKSRIISVFLLMQNLTYIDSIQHNAAKISICPHIYNIFD